MRADPNVQSAQPNSGRCATHNLQTAPDGLCAICRRERAAAAAPVDDTPAIPSWAFGALALLLVGGTIVWAATRPPSETVEKRQGPTVEQEIAVTDAQIKELRIARKQGDLNAEGLNQLSRLEARRAVLDVQKRAQDDN